METTKEKPLCLPKLGRNEIFDGQQGEGDVGMSSLWPITAQVQEEL